jgi:DNA polymerase-3 subunit gamma/tau
MGEKAPIMAEALYRKYRPQIFDDVVGQDGIEDTLKAAIATGRLSHAYMFCGPRGTGKTTTARLVAKALLCEAESDARPDGTCEQCELIADGLHPDVYELDAASRTGVENVRDEIISRVAFAPMRGRYKIYIIDEVHMLSTAAFNALLKTLEEPPAHVVFIMCTTDPQKVPATIQSRCQRFDFKSIDTDTIATRLAAICEVEGIQAEPDALVAIADHARGGMRDALTNLEQASTFGRGKVDAALVSQLFGMTDSAKMDALLAAILQRDMAACYDCVADVSASGIDCGRFIADFASYLRGRYLALLKNNGEGGVCGLPEPPADFYAFALSEISKTISDVKTSSNPSLDLELFCVRATHPQTEGDILALSARVAQLEARLAQGEGVSVAAAVAASDLAVPASLASTPPAMPSASAMEPAVLGVVEAAPTGVSQTDAAPIQNATPVAASTSIVGAVSASNATTTVDSVAASTPAGASHPPLAQAWAMLLGDIQSQSPQLSMFLNPARPRFSSQTFTFVIKYARRDKFYFDGIQSKASREVLTAALQRIYGRPVNLKFELVDDPVPSQSSAVPAASAQVGASVIHAQGGSVGISQSAISATSPEQVVSNAASLDVRSVDVQAAPQAETLSSAAAISDSAPITASSAVNGQDAPPFATAFVATDATDLPPFDLPPQDLPPFDMQPLGDVYTPDVNADENPQLPDGHTPLSLNESKFELGIAEDDDSSWQADLQSAFSGQVRIREIDR